ncbi:hypothetical protein FHR83_004041 [Actinoplanes campanulatus]|uniref:DUF3893 domain-containing protein n=1 Tax=Actinoplanes campanulatus TaxID=113559 RepID=A0A7W5FFD2_9ACTN|nr:DUF3962 domain-containing protein [Actinoplanes campanulatus]MBB3096371.1 hypothetical protein [Actinoplanes campanulatus]GGN18724.1 hypothetical protein GCM10010109_31990 [Actinoplanes campanulatus]GID38437.1 hypothetical protein Aca09nite_49430 [Actinoplanes campanulatus]
MAPRYDQLAVTVLRLNSEHPFERDYHVMRFPGRWKEPLRALMRTRRADGPVTVPIAPLNEAITALVPDCVVTLAYAGKGDDDEDWLLAYREINPAALFNLVAAWVRAQKADPEQIRRTLSQLNASDLTWSPVRIDLTGRGGFAQISRLLPMEIAATLSRPESVCPHGNLRFVRCPAATGAELMSWPPERTEDGRPFSVKIGITVQTVPTSDEWLVYLSFGVRRWLPSRGRLASDHGHSVYLAPTVPYLAGLENSRHFGTAKIRSVRVKDADGKTSYPARWDDSLANVLEQAGCLNRLPDPEQVVATPMDYLQRTGDAAALVYRNGMLNGRREKVSAGLPLADRVPILQWITEQLAPRLHQVGPLPRVKRTVYPGLSGIADGAIAPAELERVVGSRLTIELLTGREAMQYALERLSMRLGRALPSAADLDRAETVVRAGPTTVTIRHVGDGRMRSALDRGGRTVQEAVQERFDDIAAALRPATGPTAALVEIGGPKEYETRTADDPKFAIRHGLLRTGRLSQFVTPVTEPDVKADRERCNAAVDELFRQLGLRPSAFPFPAPGTLERQPALLALWMIRRNKGRSRGVQRQIPIAVLVDPTGREVQVRAPKVDWQPLHSGLLGIGDAYLNADLKYTADGTVRFIKEAIEGVVAAYPDTLLLTHAQNLRGPWKTLTNGNLVLDALHFGAGDPVPMSKLPGLRHVRVRTVNPGDETPECFGVSGDEVGQPGGLWAYLVPRLYGSTAAKPVTQTSALKGASKVVPGDYDGKPTTPRPQGNVWNAQFVELLVAGIQDGDRPEDWAALAHDLRNAAPYVRDTTNLPWPLHLAEQVEEYLMPNRIEG